VYTEDVNLWSENINSIMKNTVDILHAIRKVCLEVNTKKSKYALMSHDYNAWQNHKIKLVSNAFKDVAEFRYLGMMVANQNHIYEEVRKRLNLGYVCCHLV
jgi:hypothetical protein